jgi:hypothetical protein
MIKVHTEIRLFQVKTYKHHHLYHQLVHQWLLYKIRINNRQIIQKIKCRLMYSSIVKVLKISIQTSHSQLLNNHLYCLNILKRYSKSTNKIWNKILIRNKLMVRICHCRIIMRTHLQEMVQCQVWILLQVWHQVLTNQVNNLLWRVIKWERIILIVVWCHLVHISSNSCRILKSKIAKMKLKWAIMKHF